MVAHRKGKWVGHFNNGVEKNVRRVKVANVSFACLTGEDVGFLCQRMALLDIWTILPVEHITNCTIYVRVENGCVTVPLMWRLQIHQPFSCGFR
ncbi:unnamed protein product [Pieris brassicae]|uniref:Uncharacterized protein n=1 Tax=Pieris brassicae TaxID=7116 RepID=A0A9P0TSK7_PIEBR|nr:unnamed protein product [Pieris brassicae]